MPFKNVNDRRANARKRKKEQNYYTKERNHAKYLSRKKQYYLYYKKKYALESYKLLARAKVRYAIKIGKLVKPIVCERYFACAGRIEAHHNDYKKALEVRWLCTKHHKELHYRYD